MQTNGSDYITSLNETKISIKASNARSSADCGSAKPASLYTNFASKKRLKNRAVAIRLQPLVVNMSKDKHPTMIGITTLQKRVLSGILPPTL
jgi:hypothetical protein